MRKTINTASAMTKGTLAAVRAAGESSLCNILSASIYPGSALS
jgi:hypothetical protein